MQREFWLGRWEEGQIGWHQPAAHRALPAFWPDLGIPPGGRVFVPLCGKSLDMVWLRERGHAVAGIDLSAVAARAFFDERGLTPQVASIGELERWTAGGYEYWVGDLFAMTERDLGPVAAVYDRAALVALPPDMRARYYGHLRRLGELRRIDGDRHALLREGLGRQAKRCISLATDELAPWRRSVEPQNAGVVANL